jgi:hypothetical protein
VNHSHLESRFHAQERQQHIRSLRNGHDLTQETELAQRESIKIAEQAYRVVLADLRQVRKERVQIRLRTNNGAIETKDQLAVNERKVTRPCEESQLPRPFRAQ